MTQPAFVIAVAAVAVLGYGCANHQLEQREARVIGARDETILTLEQENQQLRQQVAQERTEKLQLQEMLQQMQQQQQGQQQQGPGTDGGQNPMGQ